MATKRKSLAESFSKKPDTLAAAPPEKKEEDAAPPLKASSRVERPPSSKSRVGKKPVTAFINPEAAAQLKAMSALEQTTQEALLIEAINDLFQKRGKGQIA